MLLQQLDRLDRALFHAIFRAQYQPWQHWFIRQLSRSADGLFYLLFVLLLAFYSATHSDNIIAVLVLTYAIERPIYFAIKNTFARTRPCDGIIKCAHIRPSDKFSLPSGHSSGAWVFAVCVAHFYGDFASVLYLWASLVALSRVLLGVHYPLDVVLGSLMGASCAMFALLLTGML